MSRPVRRVHAEKLRRELSELRALIRELGTVSQGHDGSKIPASNLEACL